MFCDKCGSENRDEADFCVNCGSKISKNITPLRPSGGQEIQAAGAEEDYIEKFKSAVSHRYKIIKELGRGGMAIVFLAEDDRLERKVALKLLPQEFSYDENFAKRFLREAKVAGKLQHPNIIQIHDVEPTGEFYYFSMSYIEGIPLDQIIKKSGALKPKVIARIAVLVSFALQHAHEHDVIHRDIKPENIIINKKRQPIVVDFGIAKAQRSAKLSQTGMFIGTPMYMSPEQIRAVDVDGRSDVYSMGCVLYQMATGKAPFHGIGQTSLIYKQVNEMPPPPKNIYQEVPIELSDIIMKALAKDPANRYQTASELGKALHEAILAAPSAKPKKAAPAVIAQKKADQKALPSEEKSIEENLIQSADLTDLEVALEEASREKVETPKQTGDTLISPAVRQKKKKKKVPLVEEKKKPNYVSIAAMLTAAAALFFLVYTNLPDKNTPEPEMPGTAETTVQDDKQPSKTPEKSTQTASKETPSSNRQETVTPNRTAKAPTESRRETESRPPAQRPAARQETKTQDPPPQLAQRQRTQERQPPTQTQRPAPQPQEREPVKKPEPARETVRETPPPPARERPQPSVAEKKPEPPPVRQKKPVETPVASLAKPKIEPPQKTEQPTRTTSARVPIKMVQISGGTFTMGDSQGDMDAKYYVHPIHRVSISPFLLSQNEITVAQYANFLEATGHPQPPNWSIQLSKPGRPVIYVSWNDADAYAKWAGGRLPTEAEWEYAARGGTEAQKYPWGNASPQQRANYGNAWQGGRGWVTALKEPGSYPQNLFGLNDMSGNVWEWVADWFGPYSDKVAVNPTGATSGRNGKVVRGGGWNSSSMQIRNSMRGGTQPDSKYPHTGFRIAQNAR